MKKQPFWMTVFTLCMTVVCLFLFSLLSPSKTEQVTSEQTEPSKPTQEKSSPQQEVEQMGEDITIQYDGDAYPVDQLPDVSEQVLQYEQEIEKHAEKYGVEPYSNVILALMMQESKGEGADPMQASESLCGEVGCIEDPDKSVKQGVRYFSNVLEKAGNDVKLALQSYNFGDGFIQYVKENGGKYSKDLAIQYSKKMFEKLQGSGNFSCRSPEEAELSACYGDFDYVGEILKYFRES
ncbi:lysozyme family protein [Halobacillus mangrovi]|uniref:lysozyme family protein n=1 Tax=Halobacillus mangrovi TaxID=402384 RepID=UPI003D952C55